VGLGLALLAHRPSRAMLPHMRLQALRQFALSLPSTTVVKQWGECLVFKVAEKMFLLLALEAETIDGVVFKCTPEEFDELTEIDGIAQAPYCAKRLWVRVSDLAALPPAELERRIRRSYDLVVAKLPKKTQAALLAATEPTGAPVRPQSRSERRRLAR
jgi:predicted DNA-binding protein (MmcQ/YjbR family)